LFDVTKILHFVPKSIFILYAGGLSQIKTINNVMCGLIYFSRFWSHGNISADCSKLVIGWLTSFHISKKKKKTQLESSYHICEHLPGWEGETLNTVG